MRIRGAVLRAIGAEHPFATTQPLELVDLELDAPAAGEVLVRIEAAGLCHSDLSVVEGARPRPVPMLLGHEAAGIVEAVGAGVHDIAIGTRVVTTFLPRCGECAACATDGRLPCERGSAANAAGELLGGGRRLHEVAEDGSSIEVHHHLGVSAFATHAVLDRRSVVPVGADVPPHVAAVLGCAMLTGGGAVVNAGKPSAGDDIVIVGLGGVGMAALLAAASLGLGRVIGVDAVPAKLDAARALGAHLALSPDEAIGQGLRAPVVIEAAGHPKAFETAFALTAPGGTTVTVGLPHPDARASLSPLTFTAEARTVVGSYLGSAVPSRDIPRYEQLWREGRLPVESLVTAEIGLEGLNEALDTLAEGRAIRQVVRFS
ncbi:alcohol dehydrogenase catalytic domain-containing protein [Agrococcus sp. Marseille-P2731]|uniref:alcohol dehydrogenase catalytic domain-containing protein n=1 Tax=Agrococcus sp. Marseille-P2731 TaxID=1841862 RepID=UPI0009301F67|nr:alcohol dehydrogenase catalytic domain-containing protein [Agrococcus sp. Marseille-P2731]